MIVLLAIGGGCTAEDVGTRWMGLWCFEVILLPSRVIERSYVDADAVTRDVAKRMFAERYERGGYPSAPLVLTHPT